MPSIVHSRQSCPLAHDPPEPSHLGRNPASSGRCRDTLLRRGLHLLTVAVHVMDLTSTAPCGGDATAVEGKGEGNDAGKAGDGSGASGSDDGHTSDVEAFCSVIAKTIVRMPLPPLPDSVGVPESSVRGDGDDQERVRKRKSRVGVRKGKTQAGDSKNLKS